MAMAAGLDAAICNVNDDDLMDTIAAASILLNQESLRRQPRQSVQGGEGRMVRRKDP